MLNFKITDLLLQSILLSFTIAALLFLPHSNFLMALPVAWQLVSFYIHRQKNWYVANYSVRRRIHKMYIFTSLLLLIFTSIITITLLHNTAMITLCTVCIFYTIYCFSEVKQLLQRPLSQLK